MTQQPSFLSMSGRLCMPGVTEWFCPGERDRVETVLEKLRALNVQSIRLGVRPEDWEAEGGEAWYEWLFARLAEATDVLPCFPFEPMAAGEAYVRCVEGVLDRFGDRFEWIELHRATGHGRRMSEDMTCFCRAAVRVMKLAHRRQKKVVLGGWTPADIEWLSRTVLSKKLQQADAVGLAVLPGSGQAERIDWHGLVDRMRRVLEPSNPEAEIWITETGCSTWNYDEYRQLAELVEALQAPVRRCYWYSAQDRAPEEPQNGCLREERPCHFGLWKTDGTEKLAYRIWSQDGLTGLLHFPRYNGRPASHMAAAGKRMPRGRCAVITGGAGFIGSNLADRLLSTGRRVIVFDNLSRRGSEKNMRWLKRQYGDRVQFKIADTRNRCALRQVLPYADRVFHLAAQAAVTTSLVDPMGDFATNLQGTLNLLEEIRLSPSRPKLLFTSTNKVYGDLHDVALEEKTGRYEPRDPHIFSRGIDEHRPLDFHSPYGCSKGAADQYVLDYGRIFDLPTVVFRMSCIYGMHQFGTEDQGWVAHFLIQALREQPITIYGNGKQVRDVLFIEDLLNAMTGAMEHMDEIRGTAFNIGGGVHRTVSLCELLDMIRDLAGRPTAIEWGALRPGDQKYYVSDTRLFEEKTGWKPAVPVDEGVRRLWNWLKQDREHERKSQDRKGHHARQVNRGASAAGKQPPPAENDAGRRLCGTAKD